MLDFRKMSQSIEQMCSRTKGNYIKRKYDDSDLSEVNKQYLLIFY